MLLADTGNCRQVSGDRIYDLVIIKLMSTLSCLRTAREAIKLPLWRNRDQILKTNRVILSRNDSR